MDENVLTLGSGRKLAYCLSGPVDGLPVMLFHGIGESRYTTNPDRSTLDQLGVRMVTVDRPGVGGSENSPHRTILEWADDVAALGTHLGYPRFAVLGRSAGAPYAAACAYRIPDRISSTTIVSGMGPPSREMARAMLRSEFWKLGLALRFTPSLVRAGLWLAFRGGGWYVRPRLGRFLDRHVARLPASDREILAVPAIREMRLDSMLESFRPGPRGLFQDLSLLARPWGFDLEQVSSRVRVWHGEADNIVAVAFGRHLAGQLPNCAAHFLPGYGHYMLFSLWEAILRAVKLDCTGGVTVPGPAADVSAA